MELQTIPTPVQQLAGTPQLPVCTIQFADLRLPRREAAKLRGYFGTLFKTHSPLLHNHYADGSLRYGYPLVQYKIINQIPVLLGLQAGAGLLQGLFLQIRELRLSGKTYPLAGKRLQTKSAPLGTAPQLQQYRFASPWLALNEQNHKQWLGDTPAQQQQLLPRILTGNMLSFYKGVGLRLQAHQRILVHAQLQPTQVQFKNNTMAAFTGQFTTNALLPEGIGLGKAVSRGFGCVHPVP